MASNKKSSGMLGILATAAVLVAAVAICILFPPSIPFVAGALGSFAMFSSDGSANTNQDANTNAQDVNANTNTSADTKTDTNTQTKTQANAMHTQSQPAV